jgi:SEC-C motif
MNKIGRNAPCPCGSGKKYKRCCGSIEAKTSPHLSSAMPHLPPDVLLGFQRQEAREHQRRLMQGLGRPIISFEMDGYRLVAVGNEIRWSNRWKTFHDFLIDYIKHLMTPEWGNAELAKPEADRHLLLRWFTKTGRHQQSIAAAARPGEILTAAMTGAIKAFLGLAYDLYLCAHNAQLPPLLLKRLRNPATFEGALYETYVIGLFARAGFSIEMEDQQDSSTMHCEFVATHKETERKFSVEAKAVTSMSRRAGATAGPPKVRGKLYDALSKNVAHPRIVFIELGRTAHNR